MGTLIQDLRYGVRMLAKNPGFTAVSILTLALGIGPNTAIFSLIDAVLLKTLPVQNSQQLVLLNWVSNGWPSDGVMNSLSGDMDQDNSGRLTSTSFSYPAYEQIRLRNKLLSDVTALSGNESQLNVGYKGQPGRADGELVSGTFFPTLGVQPMLGRVFTTDDDRIGASPAAVISYGYWERRFGRDPGIVGQTITVNGVPVTVVGVSPPEFYGVQPVRAVEVWLPLHTQPLIEPRWSASDQEPGGATGPRPADSLFHARNNWWVLIMGRLKPGASEQQARAELEVIFQQSIASDIKPTTKPETIPHLGVESGSKGLNELRREFSKPLFILMTVVGLVLLIACANVANLLLARATARHKGVAVRLAVGAGRGRVIRQLLIESLLLAGLGGATGLILAFWCADLLVTFIASGREPITLNVTPDPRVLGFTAAISMLTGILFGLSPALRATRLDLMPALKESARDPLPASASWRGWRLGKGLVVTQVSLSIVLLVGAGLFVRTLTNLENVNAGFNTRNLLLFGIDPTQDGYKGRRLEDFYREMVRRLQTLPGVRSVSMSAGTPLGGGVSIMGTWIQGYTPKPTEKTDGAQAYVNWVGPRFFETLGIPRVLGRTLDDTDTEGRPKVAVVNQQFARQFLANGNPIGRRFGTMDAKHSGDIEIVGVVGDAKYKDLRQEVPPTVYIPILQDFAQLGPMHFEVRTAGDPMGVAGAVRRMAQDLDHNLALYDMRSQTEQINQTLFQERLFARLTGFFGLLAALLACVGVYGIMTFAVTRRTREIGIRMALGASRAGIVEMVLRETLVPVGIGIAMGIIVAFGASRLVASLLYGLQPTDPLTIGFAVLGMAGGSLLASYIPARRATKVDPMVALRYE
jgi:predicted permease